MPAQVVENIAIVVVYGVVPVQVATPDGMPRANFSGASEPKSLQTNIAAASSAKRLHRARRPRQEARQLGQQPNHLETNTNQDRQQIATECFALTASRQQRRVPPTSRIAR